MKGRSPAPLPPFGRQVLNARRSGRHGVNGFIRVVLDWSLYDGHFWRVVLPPDRPVSEFNLGPCIAGLDVHVVHLMGDEARAAEAIREILPNCQSLARLAFEPIEDSPLEFEVVKSALAQVDGAAELA